MNRSRAILRAMLIAILALLPFLAWELASRASARTFFFFSSPTAILSDLVVYGRHDGLLTDLAASLAPAVTGLTLGALVGGALGFALVAFPGTARVLRPIFAALAAFPVFVLAPMTIVWFAADLLAGKVFLAFVSCVFVFLAAAYNGGLSAPSNLVQHLRTHGFTPMQEFLKLRLPCAMDWLLESLRTGVNLAMLGVFVGEYVIAEHGLAKVMIVEAGRYNITRSLSAALCFTLAAWLLGMLAGALRGHSRNLVERISVSGKTRGR